MDHARDKQPTEPPTKYRDGFHLIPTSPPIRYDITSSNSPETSFTDTIYQISTQD